MTPERFKAIRKKLKLTQEQMGDHLGGYAKSTVYLWERGKNPVEKAAARLMEIYDLSPPR